MPATRRWSRGPGPTTTATVAGRAASARPQRRGPHPRPCRQQQQLERTRDRRRRQSASTFRWPPWRRRRRGGALRRRRWPRFRTRSRRTRRTTCVSSSGASPTFGAWLHSPRLFVRLAATRVNSPPPTSLTPGLRRYPYGLQQVPVRRVRVGGQLSRACGGHGPADPGPAARPPGRRPRQRLAQYARAPSPSRSAGSGADALCPGLHGRDTAVAYILTLPVMIALCMETGLRAFALGSVLLTAPYLAAAELGITWLGAGLFFGLPQVRLRSTPLYPSPWQATLTDHQCARGAGGAPGPAGTSSAARAHAADRVAATGRAHVRAAARRGTTRATLPKQVCTNTRSFMQGHARCRYGRRDTKSTCWRTPTISTSRPSHVRAPCACAWIGSEQGTGALTLRARPPL